ncbi:MAG TPA: hypothetical protein VKA48_08355, partial [Gammaproteobacteria bacterium]|nr:hypothetical protein [Gammaproteobacteria bacterium]
RLQEDTLTRAEQSGLGMATPEGCDPVVVQRVDSDGAVVTWRGQQLTGVPKRSLRIPGSGERGLRHG